MSISTFFITPEIRQYILEVSMREHPALEACRTQTAKMSTAGMQISPEQGQFMAMLVKLIGAKKCLEVGVFTGYSSTAVALALPDDGKLVGLDTNLSWTQKARKTWQEAGVEDKVELIINQADHALEDLIEAGESGTFDFVFIDADKKNYGIYYELCVQLTRTGGLIAIDNALMGGQVIDPGCDDENTVAVRELNQRLHHDERIDLSFVPIGDGLVLARKK